MKPVVVVTQPGRQALHLVLHDALTVGRECEGLLLADAQTSRRHLELRPLDGRVICADLGSTNGTFLDGERITSPVTLERGSVLKLGDTSIRLAAQASGGPGIGRATTIAGSEPAANDVDLRRTSIDLVADLVTADEWRPKVDAGTITILFSDIESSTQRVSAIGDAAWFELLEMHNRIFREELS